MRHRTARPLPLLLGIIIGGLLCACSNSDEGNLAKYAQAIANSEEFWNTKVDSLSLDDWEYPYANIPRIVIETADFLEIRDRETELPAKLQIWGENYPESEVMNLTIRGRGNSSWTDMPQKSYKIEFINKQEMLGMPKDRDWALIANYADKTLMKNYLMYRLSAKLGLQSPRCRFVELYINKEYLGVYLLTETIKIGKKRINIPENGTFIAEIKENYRQGQQMIYSYVLKTDSTRKPFRIHHPKNASINDLQAIQQRIENFEIFLTTIKPQKNNNIDKWININKYMAFYWIQEFSKNLDADDYSSIYFFGKIDGPIEMGPVWDFDLTFGSSNYAKVNSPENWYIKTGYWHTQLFRDTSIINMQRTFWNENKNLFQSTLKSIDSLQLSLNKAASNNFRKWEILQSTKYIYHRHTYNSYKDAVDDLKRWIQNRTKWIDRELQ
jgi:hypothetical protein